MTVKIDYIQSSRLYKSTYKELGVSSSLQRMLIY
jgi:hypothetical protein